MQFFERILGYSISDTVFQDAPRNHLISFHVNFNKVCYLTLMTLTIQRTTLQPQNCIVSQYGSLLDQSPLGDIVKQFTGENSPTKEDATWTEPNWAVGACRC